MATAQAITWRERLGAYYYLCRFDNPIGTELVFWPTLWALWIAAQGMPRIEILIPMILGVIFMRAAGCAINDFADRKVDAHVERTKNRPLATGVISAKEAVMVFLVLVAASACLLFFLPIETFYWSFGALLLAFIYPFMKRYTHLPQVFLAWTVAYDTQYAIADREYDLKIGVKSTAILFGQHDISIISTLQASSILLIGAALWLENLLIPFGLLALLLVAADFIYQWFKTRDKNPQLCFWAFRHNRWIGLIIFVGILFALR